MSSRPPPSFAFSLLQAAWIFSARRVDAFAFVRPHHHTAKQATPPLSAWAVESLSHEIGTPFHAADHIFSDTMGPFPVEDPSQVEFTEPSPGVVQELECYENCPIDDTKQQQKSPYPFAAMLQMSARYIADHAGGIAVFHIPGDRMTSEEDSVNFNNLISDIALARLLGLKIVVVASCRFALDVSCKGFGYAHECQNSIRNIDEKDLRHVEEEAGFVRFELERRLNRAIRQKASINHAEISSDNAFSGNVIGGNFYTAKAFGIIRDVDYRHSGYASKVNVEKIRKALDRSDVVLLTTVGTSSLGELVHVNGLHLAATVASSLGARKLIFMANQGTMLHEKGEQIGDRHLGEVPFSFVPKLLEYHGVRMHHKAGFATFERARKTLPPHAVEMLLHLGWSHWAMERGAGRAHVINPGDGALLEELFTSKNGANTCIYDDTHEEDDLFDAEDYDMIVAATQQEERV